MADPTQAEISRVIAGYDVAEARADFAEAIVLDAENITGTRYKYILCGENIYGGEQHGN